MGGAARLPYDRAVSAVQESELRYRSVIEAMPETLFEVDLDGVVRF